ncbi:MAG: hypothetical protein IKQ22_03655 [Clostridia bacterium]|nr:hypothetical protein [Clostridia bacterium]
MEKVANTQVQKNEHTAKDDAAFKAKKAEAAKRFAENQKARKEGVKKLAEELKAKNLIEKLSPENQKIIEDILNPATRSGFGGQSFFNKVFGDSPKVGDSITLLDYMKKTLQAKGKLDKAVKDWAEKGIVVEFTEKPNQLESVYTIKKM